MLCEHLNEAKWDQAYCLNNEGKLYGLSRLNLAWTIEGDLGREVWAHIKHQMAKDCSHIISVKEKKMVLCLRNDFADNQRNGLIESMPDRIKAVIAARGGSISY